jgi:O-antigen/teichoic acid export membrane protein
VVIAKLRDPESVGAFALALAVTAPISLFLDLRLRALEATDATEQFAFHDYLGLRVITASLSLCTCALVSLFPAHREHAQLILAVALFKCFESISDVLYGLMQKHERMDLIALSLSLKGIGPLLVVTLLLKAGASLVTAALSIAAVWACLLLIVDLHNTRFLLRRSGSLFWPSSNIRSLLHSSRRLARLALPLGVVAVVSSLYITVPRYVIQGYLGSKQLGYFAAVSYLTVVMARVVVALGEAVLPRLGQLYVSRGPGFTRLLARFGGLVLSVTLGAVGASALLGREFLTLLYRPEYAPYSGLLVWVMAASAVDCVGYSIGHGLVVARYLKTHMLIALATAISTTCGCLFLVPAVGLRGAAWGLGIGALVQLVGSVYASLRVTRTRGVADRVECAELCPERP